MPDLLEARQLEILRQRACRVVIDALEGREMSHEPCPDPAMDSPRGVFVTLRRRGALAGCIGYPEAPWPLWDTLGEAARSAALEDDRFDRIPSTEFAEVELEISVLSPPHEIQVADFERARHGLLIEADGRRGLLLPQVAVEHHLDREGFLDALCRKAGLPRGRWREPACRLLAFEAQIRCGSLSAPDAEQR